MKFNVITISNIRCPSVVCLGSIGEEGLHILEVVVAEGDLAQGGPAHVEAGQGAPAVLHGTVHLAQTDYCGLCVSAWTQGCLVLWLDSLIPEINRASNLKLVSKPPVKQYKIPEKRKKSG